MMKRVFIGIGVLALAFGFVSCGVFTSDDDGDGTGRGDIFHIPKVCVAWQEDPGTCKREIYVKCKQVLGDLGDLGALGDLGDLGALGDLENLGEWEQVGTKSLNVGENTDARRASVALDKDGVPLVAWEEYDFDKLDTNVYVKRWDEEAGSWELLGDALNITASLAPCLAEGEGVASIMVATGASYPSLSIGKYGTIVVALLQYSGVGTNELFVRRWNGTQWETIGEALNINDTSAITPSLAVLDNDLMFVAWREYDGVAGYSKVYVKRWKSGNSWSLLGGDCINTQEDYAYDPVVAVDKDGVPYVSFEQNSVGTQEIITRRWNQETNQWMTLKDTRVYADYLYDPQMALDNDGNPLVMWQMWDETYLIYVKQWNGQTWKLMGESLLLYAGTSAGVNYCHTGGLAIPQPPYASAEAIPYATWMEQQGGGGFPNEIWTKYWDGTAWVGAESLNINPANYADYPSMAGR